MSTDRNDRFATAVDFARALQRIELELGYAPTTIDVPNLFVEAPDREESEDGADETRARTVATIEAQPPIQPPLVGPGGSGSILVEAPQPAAEEDRTQVRGAQRVDAQPPVEDRTVVRGTVAPTAAPEETVVRGRVAAQTPEAAVAPAAPKKKSSTATKVIIWVSSVVAVLIAASIVISFVVVGSPTATLSPKPTATGGSAVVETTPVPVRSAGPVLTGGTVTFSAQNPKPKEGDSFIWQISSRGDSEPRHTSSNGSIPVQGYRQGETLCINVFVIRKGKESAPLEMCYPES